MIHFYETNHKSPDPSISNEFYVCDAKDYCWKVQRDIPEYSIFNLFNLGSTKQVALYEQGIINIQDIPRTFAMTAKQSQAVQNYKLGITHIDSEAIKSFLGTLSYL